MNLTPLKTRSNNAIGKEIFDPFLLFSSELRTLACELTVELASAAMGVLVKYDS